MSRLSIVLVVLGVFAIASGFMLRVQQLATREDFLQMLAAGVIISAGGIVLNTVDLYRRPPPGRDR